MPELDQGVGLVGRASTVELVEHLVERDSRRRLPVVVAYGPGGSGKTALITHLERRYDRNTPLAKVELTQDSSRTPQDILDAVYFRLCRDAHRTFGRLRLPRYEAARIIRDCASETVTAPNPHGVVRARLSEQLTTLSGFIESMREGGEISGGVAGFMGRLLRPLTRWMIRSAVVAPRPLRWLLAGPKGASAFRWYEQRAHEHLHGVSQGVHVDAVGAHIHGLINDEPVSDSASDQLNAFMTAALLADLRAEYRFRSARKTNCVVLLDNADLLSPDEAELWAVSGARQRPPRGKDLLDLVAEELSRHPDTPLLLVATKQGAPASDGFDDDACDATDRDARDRYQRWLSDQQADRRPPASYLPVRLDPFTLDETRQLLRELSEQNKQTMHAELGVREIHHATHGHPLAVALIAQKLSLRSDRDSSVPSVRSVFEEFARPEEGRADRNQTVREYLLMRFLQRFRTRPLPESTVEESERKAVRSETTELLSRLAAPLWLTDDTVDLLASDRDPSDLQRIKDYLPILSFVRSGADGHRTVHPLLRDLLVKELLANDAGSEFSYDGVHLRLAQHFGADPWDPGWLLAMHYHLLALGEVEEVARHFAWRAQRRNAEQQWQDDLERIVVAPDLGPGDTSRIRERLHTRDMLWDEPRSAPFEDLINALRTLLSCTGDQRWDEMALAQLEEALQAIAPVNVETWRKRYGRLRAGTEHLAVPPLNSVLRAEGRYRYPVIWWPRHGFRRLVAATLALALVGYATAYFVHVNRHCDRGGLGSADAVRWLWDDTTTLVNDGGECVGIGTGVGSFLGAPMRGSGDPPQGANEREIVALTELIDGQNREVERRRRQEGKPYATIVVPTILSTKQEAPRRELAVGVNELRGAFLAQQQWNALDAARPFYVRLVPANVGGGFVGAPQVAEKIRRLAAQDPTVIGVTGLSQTREETRKAVGILGRAGQGGEPMPMVSSQASGDELSGMPYFFRIAVSNRTQADAGTEFLSRQPGIEHREPFLLTDGGDRYSIELAAAYDNELRADLGGLGAPTRLQYGVTGDVRAEMELAVGRMCEQSRSHGRTPLLIYTGRANEAVPALQALGESECRRDTVILGSDDLAQLDVSNSGSSALATLQGFRDDQFLFTSYSISNEQVLDSVGMDERVEHAARGFFAAYERMTPVGEDAPGRPFWTAANGHVVDAYDAVRLLLVAADRGTPAERQLPLPGDVYEGLRGTTGDGAYFGASGLIDFGGSVGDGNSPGSDPQEKQVTVNRVAGIGGDVRIEYVDVAVPQREGG